MIFFARAMSIAIVLIGGFAAFSHGASLPQPVFGKSLEEVEKMAAKEGKLRMISNLFPEEVPQVLKGLARLSRSLLEGKTGCRYSSQYICHAIQDLGRAEDVGICGASAQ